MDASMNKAIVGVVVTGPLGHGHSLAFDCNWVAHPFVVGLLKHCRPSAILFAVALVVVNALNAVGGAGARAHILNERFHGISPAFAHCDSASTVTGVALDALVVAPLEHHVPDVVERMLGKSVRSHLLSLKPSTKAAATYLPSDKVTALEFDYASAVASALPHRVATFVVGDSLDCREYSESTASDVDFGSAHGSTLIYQMNIEKKV